MYDWVYLCCNRYMLELFLDTLPEELEGLRHIRVIRNANVQLNDLKSKHHSVIHQDYEPSSWVHPKQRHYSLSVKLDLHHYTDINMLYSDDDVICLRDPSYLGRFCTGSHLDGLKYIDRDLTLCSMLSDAVGGWDMTPLATGCDAGIWYLPCDLFFKFQRAVYFFFNDERFDLVFSKTTGNFYRTIDQRIMTAFFNAHHYNFVKSTKDVKVIYSMQSTIIKKRPPTFYHYGCSSHKPEAAKLLRDFYVAQA